MVADIDLSGLYSDLRDSLKTKKSPNNPSTDNKTNVPPTVGGYQSPIKGSWKNSGDYSPTIATDARHPHGHGGVDMRAPGGTSVFPMAPGVVANVGTDPKGGNIVLIQHDNNVKTYYAHLGSVSVHKGEKVTYETVIGTVGDTGNAQGTWPHVHFQVWKNGTLSNPGSFFTVPKYENVNSKIEKKWLPGAQEQVASWTMKNHLQQKRIAFSQKVDLIFKLSSKYYKLSMLSK